MPTFSIITITFNAEKYLERTIKSIISQIDDDYEFLIIDGGSTDDTLLMAENYKDNIDILISEKDRGIYDAMNKGIQLAKGKYIWFMNAGDEIASPSIISEIKSQISAQTDLIYGDAWFVNDNGLKRGLRSQLTPHRLPNKLQWQDFKHGMLVCHQSFIAAKTIIENYEIDNLSADLDYEIIAIKNSQHQLFLDTPIANYLEGGVSNKQLKRSLIDRFKIISKHFGTMESILAHIHIFLRGSLKIMKEGKYW